MRLSPHVLLLLAGASLAACGAAPQATRAPVVGGVAAANDTTNGSRAPVTNVVAPVTLPVTQVSNVPVESYPPPCGRG